MARYRYEAESCWPIFWSFSSYIVYICSLWNEHCSQYALTIKKNNEHYLHIRLRLTCLLRARKANRFLLGTLHFRFRLTGIHPAFISSLILDMKSESASRGFFNFMQIETRVSLCSSLKRLGINFALTHLQIIGPNTVHGLKRECSLPRKAPE